MTVEEIFCKLSAHMAEGLMTHNQLANYYHFLNLEGYKCCHVYHYLCETISHIKLQRFYINKYNKLIPQIELKQPDIIPNIWYKNTRQDVNANVTRKAAKEGLEKWINWEKDTYNCYVEAYKQLEELNELYSMQLIETLIADVEEEIQYAEKKLLELSAVDFSLDYIMLEQEKLYKKYKSKKKELF